MTLTDPVTSTDLLTDLLTAAPGALEAMAGAAGWTVAPGDTGDALPSADARAVVVDLGGAGLRLLVDPELARHLQVGPPPADDLLEGARPALDAVAARLGAAAGAAVETGPELPAPDRQVAVVRLLEGDRHRASLVLDRPAPAAPAAAPAAPLADLSERPAPRLAAVPSGLELLHDVELAVTVELGRTRLLVREVLDLVPGSVIELDRAAGSPVDVLVNGTMIARGEVVVVDEEFGVRITEVIGYEEGTGR